MYGDGLTRGPSAGDLADAFEAELNTGRLNPTLERAVGKMLGVSEVAETDGPMATSAVIVAGARWRIRVATHQGRNSGYFSTSITRSKTSGRKRSRGGCTPSWMMLRIRLPLNRCAASL